MTDAEYEALMARIIALKDKWHYALGLGHWRVTYEYDRAGDEFDDARGGRRNVAGICKVDWQYAQAKITFNMDALNGCDDDTLEETFVHECMHILVNEMRGKPNVCQPSEERVCSMLERAFRWTWEEARKYQPVEGEY